MLDENTVFSWEMVRSVQFFLIAVTAIGFIVLASIIVNTSRSKTEKDEKDKRLKRQRDAQFHNARLRKNSRNKGASPFPVSGSDDFASATAWDTSKSSMIAAYDIDTRVISEDESEISFAIKAVVQNRSDDPKVVVELQGLDRDGFAIYDAILEGTIPIGTSRVLTDRKDSVDKKLFEQIVGWYQK